MVDLTPGSSNPISSDPSQSGEDVIVGDSRGEQGTSGYNGRVTLAYLFGQPIVQVTTNPGESKDGPLQPLQDGLDQLCDASGNQLCLTLLGMHSSSTSDSSTNSFEAVGAHIAGQDGINADVLTSNGNVSDDGTCQTAHGDSSPDGLAAEAQGGRHQAFPLKALRRDGINLLRGQFKNAKVRPAASSKIGGVPTRSDTITFADPKGNDVRVLLSVGTGQKNAYLSEVVVRDPTCQGDLQLAQLMLSSAEFTK